MKCRCPADIELCVGVAPFAGAWIEIQRNVRFYYGQQSLPSRERGLKFVVSEHIPERTRSLPSRERGLKLVFARGGKQMRESLPSRECGLKLKFNQNVSRWLPSLPSRERGLKFTQNHLLLPIICRSLRGSVD